MARTKQSHPIKDISKKIRAKGSGVEKKRKKPRASAERLIKREMNISQQHPFMIPRSHIYELAKEILSDLNPDAMITKIAVDALRVASESFIVDVMNNAAVCAHHAERITIMPKDMALGLKTMDCGDMVSQRGRPKTALESQAIQDLQKKQQLRRKANGLLISKDDKILPEAVFVKPTEDLY